MARGLHCYLTSEARQVVDQHHIHPEKFQARCSVVKEGRVIRPLVTLLQSFSLSGHATVLVIHKRVVCVNPGSVAVAVSVVGLGSSHISTVLTSSYVARRAVGTGYSIANTYTSLTAPFAITPAALRHA